MSLIAALDPSKAQGKVQATLQAIQQSLGVTPNLFRVAAQAPAVLEGLTGLSGALGGGKLPASVREAIALTVAEANACDYCLSAHTVLGKGAGLSQTDIDGAREAAATDSKVSALLRFSRALVVDRGRVTSANVQAVRQAGASDEEVLETIANVVLNLFTNYVNLAAETDIDFPHVRARSSAQR